MKSFKIGKEAARKCQGVPFGISEEDRTLACWAGAIMVVAALVALLA